MTEAFFVADGPDRFIPTQWTVGPWSAESQHGGPPAALLGRAIERVVDRSDFQVARATFEILRPVPLTPLHVRAEVVRPGRSVVLASASLSDDRGVVMQAQAWSIRIGNLDLEQVTEGEEPPSGPESGQTRELFPSPEVSYMTAMEWRFVRGGFLEPGPATVWARMRHPLIQDEEITPLSRVLVLADSGSGISSSLDFQGWIFINPDLSVYLHRSPRSEWVCLDARTSIEPTGIGLAASVLSDEEGVIGRGLQSLFVAPRLRQEKQ